MADNQHYYGLQEISVSREMLTFRCEVIIIRTAPFIVVTVMFTFCNPLLSHRLISLLFILFLTDRSTGDDTTASHKGDTRSKFS